MAQRQADATTDREKAHIKLLEHLLNTEREAHRAAKAALEAQKGANELQLRYRDSRIRELESALAAKGTTALLKDYLRQEGDKPMGVHHVNRLVEWLDRKFAEVSAEAKPATTQKVQSENTLNNRHAGVDPVERPAGAACGPDNGGTGAPVWTTVVRGGRKAPAVTQLTAVPAIQTAEQRRAATLAQYNVTLSPEVEADIAKRGDSSHVYETSEVAASIYVKTPTSEGVEKVASTLGGLGDVSKVIYDASQIGKNKNVRYEVWVHPACVDIVSKVVVNVLHWSIEKGYDPSQPAPTVRNDKGQVDSALARVISRYNHLLRKTKSPEVRNAVEERLELWGAQRASLASFFAKPVPSREEAAKQSRPQKRKMVHSPVRPTGPPVPPATTSPSSFGSFEREYPMLPISSAPPTSAMTPMSSSLPFGVPSASQPFLFGEPSASQPSSLGAPSASQPSPSVSRKLTARTLQALAKRSSAAEAQAEPAAEGPTTEAANVDMDTTEMDAQSTQPPPATESWAAEMEQHDAAQSANPTVVHQS